MTRALTTAAFGLSDIEFVELHHDEANAASKGVAQALGFELVSQRTDEVSAPGEVGVDWFWRIGRTEWLGRRSDEHDAGET